MNNADRPQVPKPTVLGTRTLDVAIAVEDIGLEELRERFRELTDRANELVQLAGHDLDEVILERFFVAATPGETSFRSEAAWLADKARVVESIAKEMASRGMDGDRVADVVITGLGIDVVLDVNP